MPGARLGVDVGAARIGIARCDASQRFSVPVETVLAGPDALGRVAAIAGDLGIQIVYVGLPLSLTGGETASTEAARSWAQGLAGASSLDVRLIDERLSTRTAQRALHDAGRSIKTSRSVIDQQAAIVLLEHALDIEKRTGQPAGEAVKGDS